MVDCNFEHLKALHHNLIDLIQHIANMVPQLESTFYEVVHLLDHLAWHLKLQTPSTRSAQDASSRATHWQAHLLLHPAVVADYPTQLYVAYVTIVLPEGIHTALAHN